MKKVIINIVAGIISLLGLLIAHENHRWEDQRVSNKDWVLQDSVAYEFAFGFNFYFFVTGLILFFISLIVLIINNRKKRTRPK